MHSWKRLAGLAWSDRRLLGTALFLAPLTALAVRALGLQRWQRFLARLAPLRGQTTATEAESLGARARNIARLVEAAARRGPYRPNCLQRSVTLWWLLRRRGIVGDLRIGTRKVEDRFEAHAWVEFQGVVLNDSKDIRQEFAAFDRALSPMEAQS